MAFADRLEIAGTCVFYWAEVDGANALWFNRNPPTNWTLSQDVYATLAPPDTWAGLESRVEPFAGIAPSGRLSCVFRLPPTTALATDEAADPWLSYVASDVTRGPITVLTDDLSAADTTATVEDTSDFPSSGTLYLGAETLSYSGKTATTFTGLTRGLYGSFDQFHLGSLDQIVEVGYGGGYVTDRLFALQGRRLRVYCGTGFLDSSGNLIAYGADEGADDNRLIFSGFVRDVQFDAHLSAVSVTAESLRSSLAKSCATRLPRAICGAFGPDRIYLSDDNNRISWAWWPEGVPSGSNTAFEYSNTRLQRDDGASGTENVPDGWYPLSELSAYIAFTIGGNTLGNGVSNYPDASGGRSISAPVADALTCIPIRNASDERGGRFITLRFEATLSSLNYAFQLTGGIESQSLWRELGYTSNQATYAEYVASTRSAWSLDADRLEPRFYLPAGRRGRQIAYTLQGSLDFQTTTGFVDDAGNAIAAYARIGEEVVRISATGTESYAKTLTISGRGQLGSRPTEIYVENTAPYTEPDTAEIVQGVVFPGTSWGLAALQLAQSGNDSTATYDTGWRGSGCALNPATFDAASWLEYGSAKRSIARFEPFDLDTMLANEAVGARCAIVEEDGALVLKPTDPPLEIDSSALALTTSNLITLGGPGVKMSLSESRIVNQIVATDVGYDPGADFAAEQITWTEGTSAGTYGDAPPLTLSMRNVAGREIARAEFLSIAQVAASSWSRPVYALDLSVASFADGWTLEALDPVVITHPLILNRASPGRGVTALRGRVYGVRPNWRGDNVAALVRVIAYSSAQRFSGYAPTAYVNNLNSTTVLRVDDHYDSADDDAKDVTRFAAGYRVRLYKPGGDTGNAESRVLDSVTVSGTANQSTLTLTAATGLAAPFLVEFDTYDTSGIATAQQNWVYLSDGDGVVGSGTDKAFLYV